LIADFAEPHCGAGAETEKENMKAVEIARMGSYAGLEVVERPQPVPGHGQALVRVHATSLNYRDLLLPRGLLPMFGDCTGRIPLSDGAGEVVAVGPGVERVTVGDRVACNAMPRWMAGDMRAEYLVGGLGFDADGTLAEFAALDADALVKLPDYMSYTEAASLPCAAVSAWTCLTEGRRPLRPGETVLVLGSGGVSLFALQLAKTMGARVIATTSSPAKAERLLALGADATIDYNARPDWDAAVLELTGGQGVDRVVEIGGAGTFMRSANSTRVGGTMSCVGFVAGHQGGVDPLGLIQRVLSVNFYIMGSRVQFEAMLAAMALHKVHPVIDRTFAMADVADAYAFLESGKHVGKVVITL
jgi:NADPH:quinone reductase-like Zn-dependent oxidoreductase